MNQTVVFLKKILKIPAWEIVIKNGRMIRTCKHSGKMEFRDCKTKNWIPIENANASDIEPSDWIKPCIYQVDDSAAGTRPPQKNKHNA